MDFPGFKPGPSRLPEEHLQLARTVDLFFEHYDAYYLIRRGLHLTISIQKKTTNFSDSDTSTMHGILIREKSQK